MQTRALRPVTACSQDAAITLASLARYWLGILPLVRRELRHWELCANAIPDPVLREHALSTLHGETLNAEAAAVFATLVSASRWQPLVRLLVAFQVMYDYLDTVSEQHVPEPLPNGLQLHRALAAALDASEPPTDYYRHHPQHDDGGYLDTLVARCRESIEGLPAAAAVLPVARRAAQRCGAGQSHTHAARQDGNLQLAIWASRQDRATGYLWWELAAGAISSVGIYALLAAAADPRTTSSEAIRIDAAYFPPMCAISTLLDSLIDRDDDVVTDNHSSFGQYARSTDAAGRLALIAERAESGVRGLRHSGRHAAILAGIAGYYLSADGAKTVEAQPVAAAIVDRLGPMVSLILATMRLRRHLATKHEEQQSELRAPVTRARRPDAAERPSPSQRRSRRAARRRRG